MEVTLGHKMSMEHDMWTQTTVLASELEFKRPSLLNPLKDDSRMLLLTVLSSLALSCFAIKYAPESRGSLLVGTKYIILERIPLNLFPPKQFPFTDCYFVNAFVRISTRPLSTFRKTCQLRNSIAFDRTTSTGYSSAGDGQFDRNAVTNIQNAFAAGLGTDVYMTPQPKSSKSGAEQFDEMYDGLKNNNIDVQSVAFPANWHSNTATNIDFLSSILSRTNKYRIPIGIYTNYKDWDQIVGRVQISGPLLWYRNVYSVMFDFAPFAGWTSPTVTQYGEASSICGVTVRR
ncbi:hypothetical protein ANCCAN_13445 [Ancylostoma caninum]|uniref:Lysozyme n=1 Tax=Ancylostoma caninum TaxID=29170 RepID=A0A368G8A4_ANCCA|nr:hypothetical protein ANCCAN_13445 [Ancylostoma caninum]